MTIPRVMLVDDTPSRAAMLETALVEQGYSVVCRLTSAQGLLRRVDQHQPDIIIIDLESPDRDVLESMAVLSEHNPKPVIMFAESSSSSTIGEAVKAGVSAYVVDGFNPNRVKPILDVAIARFDEFQLLKAKLTEANNKLADRKLVERAKGLLMAERSLSEPEAFNAMRNLAMDQGKTLTEVARSTIALLEILNKGGHSKSKQDNKT